MPRKPKYSREAVIQSAFEVTQRSGIEAVTAASVAANMNYTGSSLFTHFDSVEEIRQEVYNRAKKAMSDFILESMNYTHSIKQFGMLWVAFAQKEPNLYRLLFTGKRFTGSAGLSHEFRDIFEPMQKEAMEYFGLTAEESARFINHAVIYANGLAWFLINSGNTDVSEEVIGRNLSDIALGLTALYRMRRDDFSEECVRKVIESENLMPEHK